MQSELNEFTTNSRRLIRHKISDKPKLHKFLISIHRAYCYATGFMHVLPDFYIIGQSKCGTSSLYEYLIQHPSIQPCVTKETRFFGKYFNRGLNWYRIGFPFKFHRFFSRLQGKSFITGEATPRYLDNPHVPQRIKKVTPNAKFIILLRNPVDRSFSQYNMIVNKNLESASFEDAISNEKEKALSEFEKMVNDEKYYSDSYFRFAYLDRSIYIKKLKNWMKIFPKNQFLIIESEELFQNTKKIFQEILEFLELPNYHSIDFKVINKGKGEYPSMNPTTRKKLLDYYKPYNTELFEFLGRRFNWDK